MSSIETFATMPTFTDEIETTAFWTAHTVTHQALERLLYPTWFVNGMRRTALEALGHEASPTELELIHAGVSAAIEEHQNGVRL